MKINVVLNVCSMMKNHFENQKKVMSSGKLFEQIRTKCLSQDVCLLLMSLFFSLLNGKVWHDSCNQTAQSQLQTLSDIEL